MHCMYAEKVSISLPPTLLDFVEEYRIARGIKSRSQVIEDALYVLRERELELAYKAASAEVDPAWEATVADGLDDEAW
jgi:antitoxin ParD1/3/4